MQCYGGGKSTGLDQTASGVITTGFVLEQMQVSEADKAILRQLADEVAEIAHSDEMARKCRKWHRLNTLKAKERVIFCDPENGWNEVITEAQMACTGALARRWEMNLRKDIFWGRVMGDDKPVTDFFDVPYTAAPDDWGISAKFKKTQELGSTVWESPLNDYAKDLPRIIAPIPKIDWKTTEACLDTAKDVFGGILNVRLKGTWWWTLGLTMPAVFLRGIEQMMFDFTDRPDEFRELMQKLSDGTLKKLDYLENNNLLRSNTDATYVGSGGYGLTDELQYPSGQIRCSDMWGFAESQETVSVSPGMYAEFVFPYEKPILDRFGLNCYGCCEPLDKRWDVVKQHKNLRRVSCSPWADYEKMAESLTDKYIFSMKVSPSDIAVGDPDWERIRSELRRNLEITKDCTMEIIMKDNHTIANRPENLTKWCRIAREEIQRLKG
ncbi:MAG: hypothetical protein ACYS3S_06705 [Planctomycetota bacterium]|jgi:hypothetical protein